MITVYKVNINQGKGTQGRTIIDSYILFLVFRSVILPYGVFTQSILITSHSFWKGSWEKEEKEEKICTSQGGCR